MKQSKAAATTRGSADCLLLMVEIYAMFGKCLHVICMTGRQPPQKCTWLEWYALQNQGHFMNQFLDSFFLINFFFPLLLQLSIIAGNQLSHNL